MHEALHELPLALFTTLASVGIGAFILLAVAFLTQKFTDEEIKKIDKFTLIPVALIVVGFVSSVFHLANPFHAMYVFSRIGPSPLANELVAAAVFFAVMAVYVILALTGKLSLGLRKILVTVVAVLAIVFSVFIGLAYIIKTIGSWYTYLVPVSMVGFTFLGAATVGVWVLSAAGVFEQSKAKGLKFVVMGSAVVGLALALWGGLGQYLHAKAMVTPYRDGGELAADVFGALVAFVVLAVAGALLALVGSSKKASTVMAAISSVAVVVGVFCARLVFYGLQISVGI